MLLLPGSTHIERNSYDRGTVSSNLSNRIPGINYERKVYYKSDHEIIQFIIIY